MSANQEDSPAAPRPGGGDAGSPPRPGGRVRVAVAVTYVAVLGILLASFPARNGDLWGHLAAGRDVAAGGPSRGGPTWLFDLLIYVAFEAAGGAGVVALKAALTAALAVALFRASRTGGDLLLPAGCTALSLLAAGNRLLVQPAVASYLFLALALLWLHRRADSRSGVWPGWEAVALFVVWANTDRWVVLGLVTAALTWVGRGLQLPAGDRGRYLARRAGSLAVLVAAVAFPAYLTGLRPPEELARVFTGGAEGRQPLVMSPFGTGYVSTFRESPAALAYYPLLGLSAVSFFAAGRAGLWERLLPWLALAALSGFEARAVPFFAVVAGPVAARNFQPVGREPGRPGRARRVVRVVGRAAVGVGAVAALVAAWPGWLQGPPYEPRRWAVEGPVGLERAAGAVRRGHQSAGWPRGSRTLHLSADSVAAFAWFCPEDAGVLDERFAADLLADRADLPDRLRAERVDRVVIRVAERGLPAEAVTRLLADPDGWPVLHLDGGVLVLGRRDPGSPGGADPFRGREVDFDRLAYRPTPDERAPAAGPGRDDRRWWEAFWRPAPAPSPDRDQAAALLLKADALLRTAPYRHLAAWRVSQAAATVAAASGWAWGGSPVDPAVRLTLLSPPIPEAGPLPGVTQATFALQRGFVAARGDVPPGVLYAAVRAARRAVAANPADASAHLLLGQAYRRLLGSTCERGWAARLPQLLRLRRTQAAAAFYQAVTLNPRLTQAHLELGLVYRELGCLDLAVARVGEYRRADPVGADSLPDGHPASAAEFELMRAAVERQTAEFAAEVGRAPAGAKAAMADRRGLAGEALRLLEESDVAAFGAAGAELELDLLLRVGRAAEARKWAAETPELLTSIGPVLYHWTLVQAHLATGDYAAADEQFAAMTSPLGRPTEAAQAAGLFGRLVGRAVLDEQAGLPYLPQVVWRALGRSDFASQVRAASRTLSRESEVTALRGLAALEAGEVERAAEAFRTALRFAPPGPVAEPLGFQGTRIARTCLGWLVTAGRE